MKGATSSSEIVGTSTSSTACPSSASSSPARARSGDAGLVGGDPERRLRHQPDAQPRRRRGCLLGERPRGRGRVVPGQRVRAGRSRRGPRRRRRRCARRRPRRPRRASSGPGAARARGSASGRPGRSRRRGCGSSRRRRWRARSGTSPRATAEAAPPLEPPGERSVSQGLRRDAVAAFSATVITPKAGRVGAPAQDEARAHERVDDELALLARALGSAVRSVGHRPAGDRREVLDRHRHAEERRERPRRPAGGGRPRRPPRGRPSSLRQMIAFSWGLRSSTAARQASSSSTAESSRRRSAAASSRADEAGSREVMRRPYQGSLGACWRTPRGRHRRLMGSRPTPRQSVILEVETMSRSASPPYDVDGRTVFITGAARGIGAAAAERLHARGANVALVGLEPERLEENAARLGDRAAFFEADVTDLEALERAVGGDRRALRRDRRRDRQRRASPSPARSPASRRARRAHARGEPARGLAHRPRGDRARSPAPRLSAEHLLARRPSPTRR